MLRSRPLARTFMLALGAGRLIEGVAEVVAPQAFLRLVGPPTPTAGALVGFRMKGGRDIALGLATFAARGDDRALADAAAAAVVIDVVDGLAVTLDAGRSLNPPTYPAGAVLGFTVAAAALWASRTLRGTRTRRRTRTRRPTPTQRLFS